MNDRDQSMVVRYAAGETLEEIASDHGMTRERVRQIVKKLGGADAQLSRERRRAAQEAADKARLEDFLNRFGKIARQLAAQGFTRNGVAERLAVFFPEVDATFADFALSTSEIFFDRNREDRFSDAVLMAGLWYLLAAELSLSPDPEWAASNLDASVVADLQLALSKADAEPADIATILSLIGAAQHHAEAHPEITMTGARYGELRSELVEALGLVSEKGSAPWPPTRQTVMKRFGGWNEALEAMGVATAKKGRAKGLVQFTTEAYEQALADFFIYSTTTGKGLAFATYETWAREQTLAGERRPSGASMRNLYGGWTDALRTIDQTEAFPLEEIPQL